MITSFTRDRLQAAAHYLTLRQALRFTSTFTILWGSLAVIAGLVPPSDLSALGLGLLLLAAGIWNRIQVHPSGVLIDAGVFVLVGGYNIAGNLMGMAGAEPEFGTWARIGVFQIVWGVRTAMQYPRFARDVTDRPAEPDARWMTDAIRDVKKSKASKTPDMIEVTTYPPEARVWQVRLAPEGALMVSKAGDLRVWVASRAQFAIAAGPVLKPKKPVQGSLTVHGKTYKAQIKPEFLARYQAWKGEAVQPQPLARAA